ncbi:hypothetical protein V8G54_028101 [Vigna mungo]|uniref:Retrotransposon Copia-like N-terminal domain-containing protein n=1 Tax=Vigna mungo TaxID=3915 RepID=A0AAQ3RLD7_VIGMU
MNPSSPFIHPSEGPSSVSITPVLDGTNYHSWYRAIRMALISKNKMAFLLGTITVPKVEEPLYSAWEKCNTLFMSWLLNSVTPSIAQSVIFLECAIDIWNDLRERFSQGDLLRIAALQEEIYGLSQGIRSGLDERFSIVRSQILLMDPLPSINRVFSIVVQQERQLASPSLTEPNTFVNAANHSFSGKGRGSGPSPTVKGASNKKCSYLSPSWTHY